MQMMKREPMDWQFDDDDVASELPETRSMPTPVHTVASSSWRWTWLAIFLVALAASWTTGFYLGRVQKTTAMLAAQIQGRLDVEAWAWQQGDWDLFRSLLPRYTPSWRLKALQATFRATAPERRYMKLSHYVVSEDGNQINAIVQVDVAGLQYEIERTYRLIDNRWRLVRLGEFDGSTARP